MRISCRPDDQILLVSLCSKHSPSCQSRALGVNCEHRRNGRSAGQFVHSRPRASILHQWICSNISGRKAEGGGPTNPFANETCRSRNRFAGTYTVPYIQHGRSLDPRAAVARGKDCAAQCLDRLAKSIRVRQRARAVVPAPVDDGRYEWSSPISARLCGKNTGEYAFESAALARAAARPVSLRWTRRVKEFPLGLFPPRRIH